LLVSPAVRANQNKTEGNQQVSGRVVVLVAVVFLAVAAVVIATGMVQLPDPSIYALLVGGVVALVMLRRRTST